MDALADLMQAPDADGPTSRPQQLRDRSWWTGPTCSSSSTTTTWSPLESGNPLAALVEHPAVRPGRRGAVHHRAHRGGAGRATFEPFMQRMKELGAQGVVLAGRPG